MWEVFIILGVPPAHYVGLVEWVSSIYTRSRGTHNYCLYIYPSSDYGPLITFVHVIFFLSWSQLHIQNGDAPLATAAEYGHTQTAQRLLEAGANVNHQNKVMTMTVEIHVYSHVIKQDKMMYSCYYNYS